MPEIGEAGQDRIGRSRASVAGEGLSHEIATLYARGAGFGAVTAGAVDRETLAPEGVVTHAAPRDVLAGARAALLAIRAAVSS